MKEGGREEENKNRLGVSNQNKYLVHIKKLITHKLTIWPIGLFSLFSPLWIISKCQINQIHFTLKNNLISIFLYLLTSFFSSFLFFIAILFDSDSFIFFDDNTTITIDGKSCSHPAVPLYAQVILSDEQFLQPGSTATYKCDDGYELFGTATRTCNLDGQWSDELPYCGK